MAYDMFERQHEILVLGGGLVGWAAALTAARAGRRVLLVSRRPMLGWEITSALSQSLDDLRGLPSPLAEEVLRRLTESGAASGDRLSAPAAELLFDLMAEEAGVELLLYAAPLQVARAGGRVCGALVGGKDGQHLLRADLVIDATDNLLLARRAGLPLAKVHGCAGRAVIMMAGLSGALAAPRQFGDIGAARHATLQPSVWPGEARLEFDLEGATPQAVQVTAPQVLAEVRECEPRVRQALVTFMSTEPLPADVPFAAEAGADLSAVAGLLVAGPGTIADPATRRSFCGLAGRMALGCQGGQAAAARWRATPAQDQLDPGSLLPPPPHQRCDVCVVGGGTGGALAAIAAARLGAKTVLLEPLTYLGGIGTGGGIHTYYHGIAGGLQDEVDRRVAEISLLFAGTEGGIGAAPGGGAPAAKGMALTRFHPDAKKSALLAMALEAGVEVHFGVTATGVTTAPLKASATGDVAIAGTSTAAGTTSAARSAGTPARRGATSESPPAVRVTAVLAAGPEGAAVYEAAAFVDATGDGDLAAMAGARFVMGREGDLLLHAFSQSAGLAKPPDVPAAKPGEAAAAPATTLRMVIVNFDAGYVDPDDITDLTRGRRLGLQVLRRERWTEQQRWTYIAPHLGLRQGRQIIGDYQLTLADQIAGQQFPDVIAYARSHYDSHFSDCENESDAGAMWVWLVGQWTTLIGCEVPYRCLLPVGVEGLVMGCRAISVTQDAHYQLRMQRDLQRIGEAAGVAAALAARHGVTPRELEVAEIQAALRATGALRDEDHPRAALPEKSADELVNDLSSANPCQAAWQLGTQAAGGGGSIGQTILPALRRAAQSADSPAVRFWSASALGMAGDRAAVPELRKAVAERRPDQAPSGRKMVPVWQPAMILLGRLGDRAALPELCGVLDDTATSLDPLIAAVRALGRIGDAAAEPAIRRMLSRDNLPTTRSLQVSMGGAATITADARWQLELASAEALAKLGRPDRTLVAPHLKDDRAYVRRYARKVWAMSEG